jgi:hypothetical protein
VDGDKLGVGEERPPQPAHSAKTAEILCWDVQEDLVHDIQGQDTGVC